MSKKRNTACEQFAAAQAMYEYLGRRVASKGRDGLPGDLRAAVDAEALEAWAEHGSDKVRIPLNGQAVGAVRVNVKEAWHVTDPDAYQVWCQETKHMLHGTRAEIERLTESEFEEVCNFIWDVLDRQDVIVDQWEPERPEDIGLVWSAERHAAIDPETGEQVPGVEFAATVVGTTIEGFKMDGAKSGAAKKYAPVRTALAGLTAAKKEELLLGGSEDEEEGE